MDVRVLGLGTAEPPHSIGQELSAVAARGFVHPDAGETDVLPLLYRMTTVRRRGSVVLDGPSDTEVRQSFYPPAESPDDQGPPTSERMRRYRENAGVLAEGAAREALRVAGVDPQRVTDLVTVTCTGFHAPGVDFELIDRLPMADDVQRVQVGYMGCHGLVNGLRVARGLAASDPQAVVLTVAVELCSLHYQYGWDSERVVANALFADGAAAMVCAAQPDDDPRMRLRATGSRLVRGTADAMTWTLGDHGFVMTLSAEVPSLITEHLRPFLESWLDDHGLRADDIGGWIVHPGGPRILKAVEDALALPREALADSRRVLAEHGNMSSATIGFVMREALRNGRPRPWLLMGFGPGLEIEVALLS